MSKEIIMAETAEAPVQAPEGETFSPADAPDTAAGVERFLNRTPRDLSALGDVPPEDAETQPSADGGGTAAVGEGGRGRGSDGPGGRGPEEPLEPPEGFRRFDWEGHLEVLWSPEFRAEMWDTVEQLSIIEAWPTELKYDGGETERYSNDLFKYWKYLESLDNKRSYESKPFTPADFEPIKITPEVLEQPEDKLTDLQPFKVVFERYQSSRNSEGEVSRYFNEMRRMGLVNGVDDSLKSIYAQIMQGMEMVTEEDGRGARRRMDKDEIMDRVEKARAAMVRSAERALKTLKRSDSTKVDLVKIGKLEGGLEAYIELGVGRFDLLLTGGGLMQPPGIEGEFDFNIGDVGSESAVAFRRLAAEGEIFWRPTWANYFEVSARTPQQFQRAIETFIRWMRTGLGKDPEDLFQKVNGFKEALTAAGQRAGPEAQEYTVGLRLLLEILMGVIGADFSNEQYKAANFKAFWQFAAKNEGPDRMLQLAKAFRGILPVVLHKFDKDITNELLFSPHGSRGQLMGRERNAIEMDDLQKQKLAILTAQIMGIAMKGYHPDDAEQILDSNMYKRNLAEITKFKSDEYFENLYEGFDPAEQEALLRQLEAHPLIRNIKFAKLVNEQAFIGPLTPEQTQFYKDWKSGDLIKSIQEKEQNIKFARWVQAQIDKGEQPELSGKRLQIYNDWKENALPRPPIALSQLQAWERLDRASRIQQYLAAGNDPDKLTGEDKIMYEEAKNVVTLAYELYGAMGEKAKRGGGVFLVERSKPDGTVMRDLQGQPVVDYIPVHWAEKFVHFAENWTKATYGDLPAAELKYRVDQARRMATWALKTYGYDAKLWDFTLLRNGKPVDPNTLGYSKYGQDLSKSESDPVERIERFRYAPPENPRILGYNSKGEEVILVFDDDGRPVGLEFDRDNKAVIYDKFFVKIDERGRPVDQEGNPVAPTQTNRIIFDNFDKAEPMLLKIPRGTIDPKTGKMIVQGEPEKVHIGFDAITHRFPSHPYSRWTGHPYWGYQEEDTGLVLSPESFDAARRIKNGQLRPEDAPPHAVQLLIVDPTLERVGHFDLESLEAVVGLAAVEESYQAHWRIGDELYMNFFPEDASRVKNRTAYILQDHGGSTKQWFHIRAEAALWPDSRVRRLRIFTPFIPLPFASMSEMWGAPGGALDVFRMMGYEKYKMVGQFAMDKWVNQIDGAQDVYESIADWYSPQEKRLKEGLGRKLNNEADVNLKKHYQQVVITGELQPGPSTREDIYEQYLVSSRDSLNREEVLQQRNTVLGSFMRGERAPLWLEGIDTFLKEDLVDKKTGKITKKGDFNPKIDEMRDSGSSRHTNRIFHYRYARFIRSPAGQALYPDTARYYALLDNPLADYPRLVEEFAGTGKSPAQVTGWDWLDSKMNN
ncbi:hypothetical protein HYZ06_00985 [Candidatus Daviesbacteria bacterium]|nr:hypothetical protein [Candidatus Daviesbacteria bacterium]